VEVEVKVARDGGEVTAAMTGGVMCGVIVLAGLRLVEWRMVEAVKHACFQLKSAA
jgi:hypothetical protein